MGLCEYGWVCVCVDGVWCWGSRDRIRSKREQRAKGFVFAFLCWHDRGVRK